jgi:5-methyltetrahydrofolate--homocysteine methyltransferase
MNQSLENLVHQIALAVFSEDENEVTGLIEQALQVNTNALDILNQALLPSAKKIFDKFRESDFFVPDVILASRAIQAGLYVLKPHIKSTGNSSKTIVFGTVEGDIHDIGKNMVILFLQCHGYHVIDLGVDVTAEKFVTAVKKHQPDIVAMSSFLTTTMQEMPNVIDALHKHNLRNSVQVMVGGGPVHQEFALSIGADLYAPNAQKTLLMIKNLNS